MARKVNAKELERRLLDQLDRESRKPSRTRREGDVIIVSPSGTAAGMAFALEQLTGEPWDETLGRLISSLGDPAPVEGSVVVDRLLSEEDLVWA